MLAGGRWSQLRNAVGACPRARTKTPNAVNVARAWRQTNSPWKFRAVYWSSRFDMSIVRSQSGTVRGNKNVRLLVRRFMHKDVIPRHYTHAPLPPIELRSRHRPLLIAISHHCLLHFHLSSVLWYLAHVDDAERFWRRIRQTLFDYALLRLLRLSEDLLSRQLSAPLLSAILHQST